MNLEEATELTLAALADLPSGPPAEEILALIQAAAFEQGQKSGRRHADRLARAAEIGRPDLPGPISPNPYSNPDYRPEHWP